MLNEAMDNMRAIMSLKVIYNDIKNVVDTINHECELNTHVDAIKTIINQMIDIINKSA